MKKYLVTLLMGVAISVNAASGAVHSGIVPLQGGIVAPNARLEISLKELTTDISYVVTCHLNNASTEDVVLGFAVSADWGSTGQDYFVNDIHYVRGQGPVHPGMNVMRITRIHGGVSNKIIITNSDRDFSIEAASCVAAPEISHV